MPSHLLPLEYWAQLLCAIRAHSPQDVKAVLPHCDAAHKNNQALYLAVHLGNPDITEMLLNAVSHKDWGNLLFDAVAQNHAAAVKILLSKGLFTFEEFQSALCVGIQNHAHETIETLCPHLPQSVLVWGVVWCGDTWPPNDPIYALLFAYIPSQPLDLMNWSGQPFSEERKVKIEQTVEQAYAQFSKAQILPHLENAGLLQRNRRI